MALILSLETSTAVCSAALHDEGKLIAVIEIYEEQTHGERLGLMVSHLLDVCSRKASSLDAIAVSSGPGSYTGLRIGVSTAKGLALSLDVPIVSVDSLRVLAAAARRAVTDADALLCPMLDARRMEVYTSVFSPALEIIQPVSSRVIESGSFDDLLKDRRVVFFGDGADKCRTVLSHPNAFFIPGQHPSAASLGGLAYEKYREGLFEDLISFEPLYLKEFLVKKPSKSQL